MKKVSKLMWTLAIGAVLVACNSTDSLINKFEKACKAGDVEKATELYEELNQKPEGLSADQQQKMAGIKMDWDKVLDDLEENIDQYEKLFDKYMNGKNCEKDLDRIESHINKIGKEVDKAGEGAFTPEQKKRMEELYNRWIDV